jgi:hypothetical protein
MMKLLSRRAFAELSVLQASVREFAIDRNVALRVFRASRNVAVQSAQHEYWLEFSWLDQEYRFAIRKLAAFCARHAAQPGCEERRRA